MHTWTKGAPAIMLMLTSCTIMVPATERTDEIGSVELGLQTVVNGAAAPSWARAGQTAIDVVDCVEGSPSTAIGRTDGDPHVDVISVYQTRSDHRGADVHPRGRADVRVDQPGRHVLVLVSYEPTEFHVVTSPGATVERVILHGYSRQTAVVPAGTTVEDWSDLERSEGAEGINCGYAFPDDHQGCDTTKLLRWVTRKVGPIAAFAGCYHATSFVVKGVEPPAPPNVDPSLPETPLR